MSLNHLQGIIDMTMFRPEEPQQLHISYLSQPPTPAPYRLQLASQGIDLTQLLIIALFIIPAQLSPRAF
jgi:hypothetical protein